LVIFSTHILSEVANTCDHIKMIEQGLLVFDGTVEEFEHQIEPEAIHLTFKNPPKMSELEAIEGISRVEQTEANQFRLVLKDKIDMSEKIIELCVAKKWRLQELSIEKVSLDRIFAKLSKFKKEKQRK